MSLLRAVFPPSHKDQQSVERWRDEISSNLPKIKKYTATIDPPNLAGTSASETEYTVTGVISTDVIIGIQHTDLNDGYDLIDHRVAANDSVTLVFRNFTAGALNPASGTWTFVVIRTEA